MKRLQVKLLLIFVILFALRKPAVSQKIAIDSPSTPALANAMALYNNAFATQLPIFNGREYPDYRRPFTKGQPYYITDKWSIGTVKYEGVTYTDVSIQYNIVTDQVVILHSNGVSKIQLIKGLVSAFSFLDHSFINIPRDSLVSTGMPPGFYDILTPGKLSLLARRTKNIQSYPRLTVELEIFSKDHYYLKSDGVYSPVSTKKRFLAQFDDKRKEIQQFIKQHKLNYRRDQENTMVKAVEYYNQLTK